MLIKWESFSHLLLDDKDENQRTKVHLAVILTISLEIREWIGFFFLSLMSTYSHTYFIILTSNACNAPLKHNLKKILK